MHVDSGRVRDDGEQRLRSALRDVVTRFAGEVRLTARQDVLLCGIEGRDRREVEGVLRGHGVALAEELPPVRRLAVACPALPTCGQALAEAERVLPEIVATVEAGLAAVGLDGDEVRVHVTGCPNGCARPYTAEIGIVGRTKTSYDVYVGGSATGERLARRLAVDVKLGRARRRAAAGVRRATGPSGATARASATSATVPASASRPAKSPPARAARLEVGACRP